MALRICESGMDVYASAPSNRPTPTARPAEVAGAAVGATNDSISRLMIRPSGPDPTTEARSIPFASANRLASGDDFTRPDAGGATCGGVTTAAGAGAVVAGARVTGAAGAGAGAAVGAGGAASAGADTAPSPDEPDS